ncbi:hypothetical protein PSYJA_20356 [Pseudomonas syringae pv. japonica str. M301072]|uniref:Uncharacterized protein n=1 Tax=Pseudomonas syringae pv. japonica str. M301072 TaxID=629262 RepID=F3FLW5_PSESX|nr:hypothetical protein PSYJA_20356 [Pseudomonas syringae pv. japonica str. M301072]
MLAIFFGKVFKWVDTGFFNFRVLLSVVAKRKTFSSEPVFLIPIHDEVYKGVSIDLLNVFVVFKIEIGHKARMRLQAGFTAFQEIVFNRVLCFFPGVFKLVGIIFLVEGSTVLNKLNDSL